LTLKVPRVKDAGALAPAPEKRVINVYQDGQISLDGDLLTIDQLQQHLSAARRQYSELGVVVRGDAEGAFQHVAAVLSSCRKAGITDLGISVRLARKDM
jgi:biopolymer transport protein ExbD